MSQVESKAYHVPIKNFFLFKNTERFSKTVNSTTLRDVASSMILVKYTFSRFYSFSDSCNKLIEYFLCAENCRELRT